MRLTATIRGALAVGLSAGTPVQVAQGTLTPVPCPALTRHGSSDALPRPFRLPRNEVAPSICV